MRRAADAARGLGLLALIAPLTAGACSTAPSGGNSVRGSVGGVAFTALDSYATESAPVGAPATPTWSVVVVVSDYADACASASVLRAQGRTVQVSVTSLDGPVAPGSYDAADAGAGARVRVTAVLERTDALCRVASVEAATAGSITLASVGESGVSGSLRLTFPDGSVSGAFRADVCGGDAGGEAGAGDDGGGGDAGDASVNGCMK